jgi:predicted N-acetyltransferase YhbS
VLAASKYVRVRQLLGSFPEMNALEARPPGGGTGTALIGFAEETARALGASTIGLAVDVSNQGARRLYERLGYCVWDNGVAVDHWDETDSDGTVVRSNADTCEYLTKPIC